MPLKSMTFFKTGWRPSVGWICVLALFLQYVAAPILTWILLLCGHNIPFPPLTDETLFSLLFALLGFGGLRTTEKIKGVE